VGIPAASVDLLEEVLAAGWDLNTLEKLVQSYLSRHQPEKALEWVKKGLKRDENSKALLMLKGNLLFSMKAYDEAMTVFDLLTHKDNSLGQAWLMLGYAAWNAEKLETAYRAMEKARTFSAQKKSAVEAMKGLNSLNIPPGKSL
jgi:predicted Zn-dependent protease